jgi:Ca-activated chloride channel family protein
MSVRYGIITPYTSFLIDESDILSQQGRARAEESLRRDAQALGGSVSGAAAVNAADAFADLSAANAPAQNQVFAPSPAATMNAVPAAPAGSNRGGFGSAPVTAPTDSELESNAFFSGDDQQQAEAAPIITVAGKTFILQDGVYTDTTYDPDTMTTEKIAFLSDAYFDLLTQSPELAEYLAIGDALIVVYEGVAYEITPTA